MVLKYLISLASKIYGTWCKTITWQSLFCGVAWVIRASAWARANSLDGQPCHKVRNVDSNSQYKWVMNWAGCKIYAISEKPEMLGRVSLDYLGLYPTYYIWTEHRSVMKYTYLFKTGIHGIPVLRMQWVQDEAGWQRAGILYSMGNLWYISCGLLDWKWDKVFDMHQIRFVCSKVYFFYWMILHEIKFLIRRFKRKYLTSDFLLCLEHDATKGAVEP